MKANTKKGSSFLVLKQDQEPALMKKTRMMLNLRWGSTWKKVRKNSKNQKAILTINTKVLLSCNAT